MLSRATSKLLPFYSFARIQGFPTISDKVFETLYNKNETELALHFNELVKVGLKPKGIAKLFKEKPNLFKSKQGDMQIKQIIKNLRTKFGEKVLSPIQTFPNLIEEEGAEMQHYIDILKKYNFNDEQIKRIFEVQPKALTSNLEFRLKSTKSLLSNYFHMNDEESTSAITKYPFLLMIKPKRYIESVKYLVSQGIPVQTLREILFKNVDIFDMGVDRLEMLFQIPQRWGVKRETVLKIILQNIDYLAQCPNQMIFSKINIMNNFKIPQRIAKKIFEEYPSVLISSIGSLDAKLILINQRLKIPLEVSQLFPYMLSLNYNGVLRPRTEIIQKYNLDLNRAQFEMSDQQFCEKNGVLPEIYQAQKQKYKVTNERDLKKKFYTTTLKRIQKEQASN